MPHESSGIIHGRARIQIAFFWSRDESISRASSIHSIRPISAINTNAAFTFTDSPLNGIEHEAVNKVDQEIGEVDVKRLFLLLCEFGFRTVKIRGNGRVVIILIWSAQGWKRAVIGALERDTFSAYAVATGEVDRRQVGWFCVHHLSEHSCPVLVPICILAAEPTERVTIIKMES
jgi:hypothetical protein